jgi:Xaa-Pro aminopeptidase
VGLNVHEYPLLSSSAPKEDVIEEGMVFTIEPGIYLPEIGGIRYENTLVLSNGIAKSFFPHDKS